MKVIWRNSKSVDISSKNVSCGSNNYSPRKDGSVTLMREFKHHQIAVGQEQQPNKKCSKDNGFILPRPESGDAREPMCRVCGRHEHLQGIDGCDVLLDSCFGVKVSDPKTKICKNCAELILHTQKFKDMICAAFRTPSVECSDSVNGFEFESLLSIAKPKNGNTSGSEENFMRNIIMKKRRSKPDNKTSGKTIVVCCCCKQKYPMPNSVKNFVCSRCKIKSTSDRSVACVRCRAVVPSTLMKEHLEMHTKADLKGRCRLRSLTKKPSEAQTTDCIPILKRHRNQLELQCARCYNRFGSSQRLEEHMRVVHGQFRRFICPVCGKDMMRSVYLDKHMKTHSALKTFDCQVCGKIFKTITSLQRHSAVHSTRLKQKTNKL